MRRRYRRLQIRPDPFTLRELSWMVEGKCRETWDHTASLLAQQINMNRAKGKSKVSPVEQNPWRIIKTVPQFTVKGKGLEILRDAFVKSKPEG